MGLGHRRLFDLTGRESEAVRLGLERLSEELRSGLGLVDGLRESGLELPQEGWGYLMAGEQTGKLGEAFCAVSRLLEIRLEARRELTGQLWYPGFLLVVGCGVMSVLLFFVIPEMKALQMDMNRGDSLPWITENLAWLYGGLSLLVVITLTLMVTLWRVMDALSRRSLLWSGRREWLASRIPWLGRYFHAIREARLLGQLSPLLQSGFAVPRALELVSEATPHKWESSRLMRFRSHLMHGAPLMEGFASCPLFSRESHVLLSLGEECGRLDAFMEKRGAELRDAIKWWTAQAMRAFEPLLLGILGLAVGGLMVAYLLPMLKLLEGFNG